MTTSALHRLLIAAGTVMLTVLLAALAFGGSIATGQSGQTGPTGRKGPHRSGGGYAGYRSYYPVRAAAGRAPSAAPRPTATVARAPSPAPLPRTGADTWLVALLGLGLLLTGSGLALRLRPPAS